MAAGQALMAQGSAEELLKAAKSGELPLGNFNRRRGFALPSPCLHCEPQKAHGADVWGPRGCVEHDV